MIKNYNNYIREDISDNRRLLIEECINLFEQLWEEQLQFINFNIVPDVNVNRYHLYARITVVMDKDDYKYFREFFDFLVNVDVYFLFKGDRLDVTIEDINSLIDELKTFRETRKYNL